MKEIGFGIVGAGNIGKVHAAAISQLPNAKLLAVADSDAERGSSLAAAYPPARPFLDYRELLGLPGIDAVCICTPSGSHLPVALAGAEAGKHILCEKPLEVSTARIMRMIEAANNAGVILGGVFQSRLSEAAQNVKSALNLGRFGRLCLGNAYIKWHRSPAYYASAAWRGTKKLDGGGVLMNQGIHQIDLLQWFMGKPVQLCAQTANLNHRGIDTEDIATVQLRFANGAFGTIEASTALWPGQPAQVAIYGTEGCAVIEDGSIKVWNFRNPAPEDEAIIAGIGQPSILGSAAGDPIADLKVEGHRRQIEAFTAAITGGTKIECDGWECSRAVELIERIYLSAQIKVWVNVEQEDGIDL
jgi:predicted dehydrogenase